MAITPRASEVEAVADAIREQKTLDDVAKVAAATAFTALQSRPAPKAKLETGLWVVATSDRLLYGPFGSYKEAETAVTNGRIPSVEKVDPERLKEEGYVPSSHVAILPMRGPVSAAEASVEADRKAKLFANHQCAEPGCGHKLARHNDKTGKCPVKTCSCTKPVPVKL